MREIPRVGSDISARERWRTVGESYAKGINGPYHAQRIAAIKALLPDLSGKRLIDFGCGEGVMIRAAKAIGASEVVGIDPDAALLERAKASGADRLIRGSVDELAKIERADCLLAANVAAYFTDAEDAAFYREAQRLLPVGGSLVITHSNELFDLYTLNAYTVVFHARHFGCDVSSVLRHPDRPHRTTFNIRENPLAYGAKLARFGFAIKQTEYMNWHPVPPLLTRDDPDDMQRPRPNAELPIEDQWKLMFQCSMFGVRAIRL